MKCYTYQNFVLLAASGELGPWRQRRLARHLVACPDCRAYQADWIRLRDLAAARSEQAVAVPDHVMEQILQAGRDAAPDLVLAGSGPSWRPALAWLAPALAVLAIGAGVLLWSVQRGGRAPELAAVEHARQPVPVEAAPGLAWDDGLDAEFTALETMASTVGQEWTSVSAANGEPGGTGDEKSYLDENDLARELLALEKRT